LLTLNDNPTRVTNRIEIARQVGLLIHVDATFGARLDRLMPWNGQPLPEAPRVRVVRE
jgi:hypothetical protein